MMYRRRIDPNTAGMANKVDASKGAGGAIPSAPSLPQGNDDSGVDPRAMAGLLGKFRKPENTPDNTEKLPETITPATGGATPQDSLTTFLGTGTDFSQMPMNGNIGVGAGGMGNMGGGSMNGFSVDSVPSALTGGFQAQPLGAAGNYGMTPTGNGVGSMAGSMMGDDGSLQNAAAGFSGTQMNPLPQETSLLDKLKNGIMGLF